MVNLTKQLGDNGTSIHIERTTNYYNNFNGKVLSENEYQSLKYATKHIDFTPYVITIIYERKK